ncbi:hypothetical protein NIES2100_05640 [Calothrix sp. NIES-2100]|uniref:hypothetical protein n=1 Tax=Calothrix sp. NIES-2100 TaxID=1954172 RepID=UPI000B5EC2B3|nr:hypothetical protein NIES2100_05640 [Calothrix sp. NIES-2100]
MSRQEALELPVWEYENLLENYQRIEAEKTLYNLYSAGAGFNGGDFAKEFVETLQSKMSFQSIENESEMLTPDKLPFNIPSL